VVPTVALVLRLTSQHLAQQAESTKHVETLAKLEELAFTIAQLTELTQGVESFAKLRTDVKITETELIGLEQGTGLATKDQINLKKDWTKRKVTYQDYLERVSKLRTFVAPKLILCNATMKMEKIQHLLH